MSSQDNRRSYSTQGRLSVRKLLVIVSLVLILGGCTRTSAKSSPPTVDLRAATGATQRSPSPATLSDRASLVTPTTSPITSATPAVATPFASPRPMAGGTPVLPDTRAAAVATTNTAITVLAWSPRGDLIAGSDRAADATDDVISLWRADGTLAATLSGHTKPVTTLDWSPGGATLASGSDDGQVRLWSASGMLLHTIDLAPASVQKVAWSPDGQVLAVASTQWSGNTIPGTVRLYSSDGQLKSTLSPTRLTGGKFFNLAWSADGSVLVGGAVDYAIWHSDGTLVASIELVGTPAWGMALARDGAMLAIGDENSILYLYESDGKGIGSQHVPGAGIDSLAFAGSSHVLAVAAGSVNLAVASPDATARPVQATVKPASNIAWSPDGHWLAAGSADQTVHVWDVNGTPAGGLADCPGVASVIAWSPDGHTLAAATDQRSLCLWHWQH